MYLLNIFLIYRSHEDQTRPRQRRGRGGTGSQSRDSSHFQDSPSPANDGDDAEDVPERGVTGRARPVGFFFSKNSQCFIFICETLNIN
uniref:Uncharacterized protein n=1 Tax=Brassica oleracea var. oleracea TaxID=109376 RepID=A0A0D2ZZQ1_BRAOL